MRRARRRAAESTATASVPRGASSAGPIQEYPGKILEAKGMQVMIDNNLDFDVALYPYELVTYGETGQVCQNWMQYLLVKRYLAEMTDDQTLVVSSGHPLGPLPLAARGAAGDHHQRPDGGDVRHPRGLPPPRRHGLRQLRPDDRRRLDVHRPPGHRPRHLHHAPQRRPALPRHPRRRRPARAHLRHLGARRHVRRPAQGRRDRRRRRVIAEVDAQPHRDAARPGLGGQGLAPTCPRSVDWMRRRPRPRRAALHRLPRQRRGPPRVHRRHRRRRRLLSDQTSCHAVYEGGYTPAGL